MNLGVVFITGLTTGGLTCLAIQGGLLATAMTRQMNAAHPLSGVKSHKHSGQTAIQLSENPRPIFFFLVAKLVAYTFLGVLLGALGSALRITPKAQAFMQIGVGLFMLANALNMFNVHPIFRYAVIQPPKFLTRYIRQQAKSQEVFTPLLLGFMTIFIPCGTTQAMELLAISSGSALTGAAIMFLFTLGTSPTFFVLGFLATKIRGKYQALFTLATAFLILSLSVVSLDTGLKLLGSPLAPSYILGALVSPGVPTQATVNNGIQDITVHVFDTGYAPDFLSVQTQLPIRLHLVTANSYGCTRGFTIPNLGIWEDLPESGETVIELPPQPSGTLYFTCSMGMYSGHIVIS